MKGESFVGCSVPMAPAIIYPWRRAVPGASCDGWWDKGEVVVSRDRGFITRDWGLSSVRRAQPGAPGSLCLMGLKICLSGGSCRAAVFFPAGARDY